MVGHDSSDPRSERMAYMSGPRLYHYRFQIEVKAESKEEAMEVAEMLLLEAFESPNMLDVMEMGEIINGTFIPEPKEVAR